MDPDLAIAYLADTPKIWDLVRKAGCSEAMTMIVQDEIFDDLVKEEHKIW